MDKLKTVLDSIAVIIASLALVVAIIQAYLARHESRRTTAMSLYKGYLDLAMANAEFVFASYPRESPRYEKIIANEADRVRYDFYVSNLLFAAEAILDVTKNDPEWRVTLRDQLSYHALYLRSEDSPKKHYGSDLKDLMSEAVSAYLQRTKSSIDRPISVGG